MARSDMGDFREIRKYAAQVQRAAHAIAEDKEFAKRLIDAVHTGSSAEVEEVFAGLDIGSDVRLYTVDATESAESGSGHGAVHHEKASSAATKPKTRTISVTIGIGPFSISVTVKKESKS